MLITAQDGAAEAEAGWVGTSLGGGGRAVWRMIE